MSCGILALGLLLYPLIGELLSERYHSDVETVYAAAIADAFFCTSRIDDMKSVVGQESNLSMLAAIGALVMVVARLTDRDAL